jgi:hypothetical protein
MNMFKLSEFIITNIVNGVKNGTFTKEYANIMSVNYMLKGVLSENDVISINAQIEEWEIAEAQKGEISADILFDEEITTDEENVAENGTHEVTEGDLLEEEQTASEELTENTEDGESVTE